MSQKERDELEAVFAAIYINDSPKYILLFKGFCKNFIEFYLFTKSKIEKIYRKAT